ncbi:fragmin A [Pelomyxa schiedti]|nr:fragmin A [Pelomyxa schiedti]
MSKFGALKCVTCGKSVYHDQLINPAPTITMHRDCFKCVKCGKQLHVGFFGEHEKQYYCLHDFKALSGKPPSMAAVTMAASFLSKTAAKTTATPSSPSTVKPAVTGTPKTPGAQSTPTTQKPLSVSSTIPSSTLKPATSTEPKTTPATTTQSSTPTETPASANNTPSETHTPAQTPSTPSQPEPERSSPTSKPAVSPTPATSTPVQARLKGALSASAPLTGGSSTTAKLTSATQVPSAGSNISLMGSELDLSARQEKAHKEPMWDGVGRAPGLDIWRIENFQVKRWPKEQYGSFFSGDSYIILSTTGRGTGLSWDVHFWLGESSTPDETGTAAFKTVELYDSLGGGPIQHREVQGHESSKFLSYFGGSITIMEGGIDSGFKQAEEVTTVGAKMEPVLYWIKGTRRRCKVSKVPTSRDSMNTGYVFVLDLGTKIFQWNGSGSSMIERARAHAVCNSISFSRAGFCTTSTIEHDATDEEFWAPLGGRGPIKAAEEGGRDDEVEAQLATKPPATLLHLSDASGTMTFDLVATGNLRRKMLDSSDAYVLDIGEEIFVWIGRGASVNERKFAMQYAVQYLQSSGKSVSLPISCINEGNEPEGFFTAFIYE